MRERVVRRRQHIKASTTGDLPAATQHHVPGNVLISLLRIDAEGCLGIRVTYARARRIFKSSAGFPSPIKAMAATCGVVTFANSGQQGARRLRGNRVGAIVEARAQRRPLIELMRNTGGNNSLIVPV